MKKLIQGIVPALITPFDESGALAPGRVPALVRSLLDAGVKGFFVCGSTGEGKAMTVPERKLMAETVVKEVGGAVPVIMHVGATSTENAVELARHAAAVGADATGSVAPIEAPKNLPAAAKHYAAIGGATDLPFYVYWIAASADQTVTADQFLEAMKPVPNFAGVKFTDTNFYMFQQLVACSGGQINAITGPDEMCLAGLVMGSDGAIGSTYNIMPRLFLGMYKAFHSGDIRSAMTRQAQANRVISILIRYGVIAGIKAVLGGRGIPVGIPRPPMPQASPERLAEMRRELERLDYEVA
jgi:N-acetylneuraminate lyase